MFIIGGNDLGFFDFVWYCVIMFNIVYWGSINCKNCEEVEKKVCVYMDDSLFNGLCVWLKDVYLCVFGWIKCKDI